MASNGTSGIERDLTRQQAVSASAASECFDNEAEWCLEVQEEELSVELCDDSSKGTSYEEAFQGPHKWRRQLRHVPSKRSKKNQTTEEPSCETENTHPRHFDDYSENQDIEVYDTGQSPYLQTVVHGPSQGVEGHPDHDPAANIPPWKRELLEKTSNKKSNNTAGGQTSQIPVTIRRRGSLHGQSESAFTRQVVNSNAGNTAARKKLSPSNSFRQAISNSSAFPGRRNISQQNALLDVPANDDLTKKRIERVQRARLYLLQQTGPNSFLIGGDSPDHKYRVIIGPQTCSCGRGPHCVHVLFVMLRVFQVGETESCLWSRTLKNYEVENLFRIYHDKRSSRITNRRPSQRRKERIQDQSEGDVEEGRTTDPLDNNRLPSESDAGSIREEEDICPICLLEMLEGESLIKCESGCHNRLHHHCIAIWFEECRRQNDPLNCPLCRAQWKTATVEIKCMQNESNGAENMSSGARPSSPQQAGTREDIARLPYAEPIPLEMEQIAAPWIEALGSDLVCCLLSRNWSIREIGLKHLSKDVMATLLKGAGEGRSGVIVSPVRRAATHNMLQTACNILAYMCADPVYRVFVASLRSLRTILAYTPCRDAEQRSRLQTILKPVVEAVILKSTDGNRRTSQLSLSTLVELVKGQEGELAVGREIFSPGNEGLDGLNYILKCVVQDYDPEAAPWQWLLGRLYVLDRLLEEFPTEFLPRPENLEAMGAGAAADVDEDVESCGAAAGHQTRQEEDISECGASNYTRLMSVAHFSVKAVCSTHMRIARMSRRVFLLSAKLGAHVQSVIAQLKDLLLQIDSTSVASLGRKLDRIVEDFQLSERIVHELMHGSGRRGKFESPGQTPMDSPSSSPRSSSPVTVILNESNEPGTFSPEKLTPTNPNPQNKRKLKRFIPRRSSRETNRSENCPEKLRDGYNVYLDVNKKAGSEASMCMRFGSASPPNRRRSNLPLRRKTIEGDKVVKRSASSATVTIRRRTHDGCVISSCESSPTASSSKTIPRKVMTSTPTQTVGHLVPLISITDTSVPEAELFQSEDLSDLIETPVEALVDSQISHNAPSLFEKLKASSSNHPVDHLSFCITEEEPQLCPSASSAIQPVNSSSSSSLCCCQCHCHDSRGLDETVTSPALGTAGVTSTPDRAGAGHYHTAEHETMSSDDFLDFSQEATSSPNEKPVSFKSEVAESPKSSPSHSVHSGPDSKKDDCGTCKEEVEKEEAEALARAMEVSDRLDPLPVVPGLTPSIREEVITIRIQPDEDFDDGDSLCKQPTMYLEKLHWVKGPLLGTGAYSSCYQARDVRTGVIMAVKQISFCRNSAQEQEKVIEAISEEIHMMARLSHPNIVRILGATKQGCHFNMFVEWMPGGSVAYLLGEYGPFVENVLVNYTRQLLRGLAYLHDNHTLHRDLKGANLLIDSTGQNLRIGDFGASARLASQATGAGEFQGQLLGTIAFMAPEVLRGENYGRSCDVWSVGCVMIEMATTKPPWNATAVSNHLALIFKIASAVDSPPIPENLSPPVRDLMLRCLEQSSEDRPSAKDLLLHPLFTRCFISPPRSTAV